MAAWWDREALHVSKVTNLPALINTTEYTNINALVPYIVVIYVVIGW
jgi:hypothetical protein